MKTRKARLIFTIFIWILVLLGLLLIASATWGVWYIYSEPSNAENTNLEVEDSEETDFKEKDSKVIDYETADSEEATDFDSNIPFEGFVLVKSDYIENSAVFQYIMYDPNTMVMYSYICRNYSGGLTVMYNADGTPKLYSSEQ